MPLKYFDLIFQIKEIEEEAYTEPSMETKQVPKQTAAVDLSKRLNDLRATNDANSLKGDSFPSLVGLSITLILFIKLHF